VGVFLKIAVVTPKNRSGERGGAENLYEGLVCALNNAGHTATQIQVIVDESSYEEILASYSRCFHLNLDDYDLVISTKAPTFMVRHRNHISWLLHTIRVFYDMFEKELDSRDPEMVKQRKMIHAFDKYGLNPCRIKKHCAIGNIVVQRMMENDPFWNTIHFDIIYPAPLINKFGEVKKGEFIFLPGRLHRWKRVDLVIEAMKYIESPTKLLIAGVGEDFDRLKTLTHNLGLEDKIEFLGKVSDSDLLDLYSRSLVIPFCPINEDFGYISIEAFKTKKPVITCSDSGEPAKIIKDGVNGFIVDPDPKKIAEKIRYCIDHPLEAARLGENGLQSVQNISWDNVVTRLLQNVEIDPPIKQMLKINVLITDMQPIEPAIGGGRLRLKGLYSNLGKNIRATYIGTFDWKGEKYRKFSVSDSLEEIDIPLSDEHFKLNEYINNLIPGKTIIDTIFPLLAESSPDYVEKVRTEAVKADVIIISHPWLYPTLKTNVNLSNKILIYDSHNYEAALREQLLGNSPIARCIVQMVKFFEKELCEESDLILACSGQDKKNFVECYGINPKKIEIFPNGVNIKKILPDYGKKQVTIKQQLNLNKKCAVFIGSEYPPNIEAGNYIIHDLAEKCPDIQFLIIGGAGNSLNSENKKNVRIFGRVSDEEKRQILSASDVAINPVTQGSGTNIKMFDFMAAGLPTITTPVGARGIINKGAFIVAERSEFPAKIREILTDRKMYETFSRNGRSLVEEYYDWEGISEKLGQRILELKSMRNSL